MKITPKRTKKVFLPKDPDKAFVEIIYLKPGVRSMIDQDSNTMTATQIDGEMLPMVEMNRKRKRHLFFKEVGETWGGFQDSHSNDLDLNVANMEIVHREIDNFYDWLQEESDKFNTEVEAKEKKAKGN